MTDQEYTHLKTEVSTIVSRMKTFIQIKDDAKFEELVGLIQKEVAKIMPDILEPEDREDVCDLILDLVLEPKE
jgi:hypothetical protein